MKIKLCGISELQQLNQFNEIGIDFAGFIFYPPSPIYVFKRGLSGIDVKKSKVKAVKVGVFVDATYMRS